MTGDEVAKNRGLWADLQRELARRQRQQQQAVRMEAQAAVRARREYEQAARASARQATADGKERKRLYAEVRKAEAASMASELRNRIAELDSVLTAGIRQHPLVTFASLKRAPGYPPFDAGGLDRPQPAPDWQRFAPRPSSGLGKLLSGCGGGLVGQTQHDNAGMTAWRVCADVAQPSVQGDQDPSRCGGCRDNLSVRRADQALISDGIDVVADAGQDGGGRDGRFSSSLNFTVIAATGAIPRALAPRHRRRLRARPRR